MTIKRTSLALGAAVAVLGVHPALAAQTGDQAPTSARPGVNPNRVDQAPAGVRAAPAPRVAAPPAAAAPRLAAPFVLQRVEVAGSSLPTEQLAAAYAPFVGKTLDGAGLKRLTDAMAAVYQSSNIALFSVAAPPQTYQDGVLRLQVSEGHVQTAVVRGKVDPKVRKRIGQFLAPVAAERPLTKATLQRQISLIREIPGFDAEIGFERGDSPTTVRLVVDGATHPFQIGMGVNTRGTAFLGRNQGQIDLIANSLALGGDQLRLSYAQPIGRDDFRSISLGYLVPLTTEGLTLSLNAGQLKTQPRDIPIDGKSNSLGAQLSYPVIRSFERNLTVSGGLDGVNSDNAFLGYTFASERTRALRLAAAYSRQKATSATSMSASLSVGVPSLGSRTLDPSISETDFRKLNLRLLDSRQLVPGIIWRTNLTAQLTGDRLPGTEQMAAGGEEFGRAYETAIINGDSGYAASGELAWRPSTGLPKSMIGSEAYGFVDGARLHYQGRAGFAGLDREVASIGAGGRLKVGKKSLAQLELVRGLTNPVAYTDREVWRLTFSVRSLVF